MCAARVHADVRTENLRLSALRGPALHRRLVLVMRLRFVETTTVVGASMSGSLGVGPLHASNAIAKTFSRAPNF